MMIDIKELTHDSLVALCTEQMTKLATMRRRRTEAARRYRTKHPDVCAEVNNRYYAKHRERLQRLAAERRAAKLGKTLPKKGELEPLEPPLEEQQ